MRNQRLINEINTRINRIVVENDQLTRAERQQIAALKSSRRGLIAKTRSQKRSHRETARAAEGAPAPGAMRRIGF